MTERASRTIQFYLVLAVGFLLPVGSALGIFWGWLHPQRATRYRLVFRIAFELTAYCASMLSFRVSTGGSGT